MARLLAEVTVLLTEQDIEEIFRLFNQKEEPTSGQKKLIVAMISARNAFKNV